MPSLYSTTDDIAGEDDERRLRALREVFTVGTPRASQRLGLAPVGNLPTRMKGCSQRASDRGTTIAPTPRCGFERSAEKDDTLVPAGELH